MDLSKLTPEGLKLFNENPDKTPEQLAELGLSSKDYELLTAKPARGRKPKEAEPAPLPEPIQKIEPRMVQPTPIPQRITTPRANVMMSGKSAVHLRNKKTGKISSMNETQARLLAGKYPHEYEIVR